MCAWWDQKFHLTLGEKVKMQHMYGPENNLLLKDKPALQPWIEKVTDSFKN